jgi:hypothetical protein
MEMDEVAIRERVERVSREAAAAVAEFDCALEQLQKEHRAGGLDALRRAGAEVRRTHREYRIALQEFMAYPIRSTLPKMRRAPLVARHAPRAAGDTGHGERGTRPPCPVARPVSANGT